MKLLLPRTLSSKRLTLEIASHNDFTDFKKLANDLNVAADKGQCLPFVSLYVEKGAADREIYLQEKIKFYGTVP